MDAVPRRTPIDAALDAHEVPRASKGGIRPDRRLPARRLSGPSVTEAAQARWTPHWPDLPGRWTPDWPVLAAAGGGARGSRRETVEWLTAMKPVLRRSSFTVRGAPFGWTRRSRPVGCISPAHSTR